MSRILFAALVMTVLAVPARLLIAQEQLPGAARNIDPLIVEWDSGPGKIDVSKYPPDIKRKYKTFEDLCARCHPLARAVNCDFVLESDWERYIKRMMRRGRSLITPAQALESYEFAVFDSKVRKRALYERRLKEQQGSN
ncbi:MAG TPA: hypothetical protein VK886_05605 [Vicinamibacterales bacterium]|nr:hypothetical protein [Vicinamibacterales bacterium]